MSESAKAEQRQGGTLRDSSRKGGSVIYHLLPLGCPALEALGSFFPLLFVCLCVWKQALRGDEWIQKGDKKDTVNSVLTQTKKKYSAKDTTVLQASL